MRIAAAALAFIAVLCMFGALAGMVVGWPGPRGGWLLRTAALLCFGAAVGLNVAAH